MLMSVAETAAFYKVDPATVWRYITQEVDPLPATKVGRSYTLWKSDVIAYQPKIKRRPGPKPRKHPPADA